MGLFNNYNKPGPGVDKNAPKKKGVFRYFEIFARKAWELVRLNFLFFVCSIPMFIIYFLIPFPKMHELLSNIPKEYLLSGDSVIHSTVYCLIISFLSVVLLGSGPASAGAAYIQRCFIREEHTWLTRDFFAKYKENFKQGIIVSIIDLFAVFLILTAILVYLTQFRITGKIIWFALFWIMCLFGIIFLLMHSFIYQLMITFENNLFNLYRNAFLMALGSLLPLLLIGAIIIVMSYLLFTVLSPAITLIMIIAFLCMYFRFPFEFYAAGAIQNKILSKMTTEDTSNNSNQKIME